MADPLYVFPDPRAAVKTVLNAEKAERWPTATISTSFPSAAITVPHIQHAWDGTPTQERQRERCTIRVTVWTPKGKVDDGINLAALVQAVLLDAGTDTVWRFRPGPGRLADIDPATGLPFCSFLITAETRPHAVT